MLVRKIQNHCKYVKKLSYVVMTGGQSIVSPKNFDYGFRKPTLNEKLLLEQNNTHPMDNSVVYNDTKHKYTVDGSEISTSCTKFVDEFFKKFDANLMIDKMINGSNWPRSGYINPNGTPMTKQEILKKWEKTGLYARNRGIWIHHNIERYFNGLQTAVDIPEMRQFFSFVKNQMGENSPAPFEPFRTEWKIVSPTDDLAGTVDFVGKLRDDSYVIYEWKRMKDMSGSLSNSFGTRAARPINHLDDCDGMRYFLQTNLYKHILENVYKLPISSMVLVSFHPSQSDYFMVDVPDLSKEVKDMINYRNENREKELKALSLEDFDEQIDSELNHVNQR